MSATCGLERAESEITFRLPNTNFIRSSWVDGNSFSPPRGGAVGGGFVPPKATAMLRLETVEAASGSRKRGSSAPSRSRGGAGRCRAPGRFSMNLRRAAGSTGTRAWPRTARSHDTPRAGAAHLMLFSEVRARHRGSSAGIAPPRGASPRLRRAPPGRRLRNRREI